MIEINLLPGKKKKAAGGGAGFKLALPDFRGLLASIKNPWLLAASAASLIVVGGGLLWFITQSTRLRVAQNRRIEVQAEKRRFDAVIAQKRQSERIRDSLVAEAPRRDAGDALHDHRGRSPGDRVQRGRALPGGGLGVHPHRPPDPVGEVAPWPCCRRTGRAR